MVEKHQSESEQGFETRELKPAPKSKAGFLAATVALIAWICFLGYVAWVTS